MARVGEGPVFGEKGGRIPIGRFTGTTMDEKGLRVHAVVWPDVMRLLGITTATLPGHDPPVAWRVGNLMGSFPLIACPAIPEGGFAVMVPGELVDLPVLDGEPGRLP